MIPPCTGVILAGGENRRFSGKNKALVQVAGKRILDHIYGVFSDLFEEIILVTNNPIQYFEWDLNIVTDLFPVRSSMTGIHAGLFYAKNRYAFVTASDTPFIKKELIETILNNIEPRVDVVVPETPKGLEPLCALYSKECLNPIKQQLEREKFKIDHCFQKVRIKTIPEKMLREKDPDLVSFININTPADLTRAEKIGANL